MRKTAIFAAFKKPGIPGRVMASKISRMGSICTPTASGRAVRTSDRPAEPKGTRAGGWRRTPTTGEASAPTTRVARASAARFVPALPSAAPAERGWFSSVVASTDARWAVRRSAGVRPSGLRALAKPGRTGSARPGSRPALAGLCPGARRAPAGRVGGGGDDVFLLLLAFLFIIPPFGQIFECAYSIRVRLLLHIVQAGDGDGRSRGGRGFVHGRLGPEGGAPGRAAKIVT